MAQANVTKSGRVNLRLNETAKRRIEQAASFEGKTVSGFIVSSALENAEKAIQKHETMALDRRGRQAASLMPSSIRRLQTTSSAWPWVSMENALPRDDRPGRARYRAAREET